MVNFTADFSEWAEFASLMEDLIVEFPELISSYFDRLGTRFVDEVEQNMLTPGPGRSFPPSDTGTYRSSFDYDVINDENGDPTLILGHITPSGPEVDRLPIYWKVLEGGAAAHHPPRARLAAWSIRRFGTPVIGLAVANRMAFSGISPQPILSELFLFDGSFTPVGLTPEGHDIVLSEMNIVREGLKRVVFRRGKRTGQTQVVRIVRTPAGPRFGKL